MHRQELSTGAASQRFMLSRFRGLMPCYLFVMLTRTVLLFTLSDVVPGYRGDALLNNLGHFLMLSSLNLGTGVELIAPFSWYISVMLVVMAFLFPVVYRLRETNYIVMPAVGILCFGTLMHNFSKLLVVPSADNWVGNLSAAWIRALLGLSLGCFAWYLTRSLKNRFGGRLNRGGRALYSLIELIFMGGAIAILATGVPQKRVLTYELGLIFGVAMAFSGIGFSSTVFSHPFFSWLGKVSYGVYLMQWSVSLIMEIPWVASLVSAENQPLYTAVHLTVAIILGIGGYYGGRLPAWLGSRLRVLCTRWFCVPKAE